MDFKRGTLLLDDTITNRSKIKSIEIVTIKLIQYTQSLSLDCLGKNLRASSREWKTTRKERNAKFLREIEVQGDLKFIQIRMSRKVYIRTLMQRLLETRRVWSGSVE